MFLKAGQVQRADWLIHPFSQQPVGHGCYPPRPGTCSAATGISEKGSRYGEVAVF